MGLKLRSFSMAAWISLFLSVLAILFPYIFPGIMPEGSVPYFLITIPIGIVSAVFAYFSKVRGLIVFAIFAGLSPLLLFFFAMFVMQIIYIVTGGKYPGPEWF